MTTPARIGLLRDSLDDRARIVEFAESEDWYRSPREAFDRYLRVVRQSFEEGPAWIRIVGEVVCAGRCEAEITAWTRYESMINLTFASIARHDRLSLRYEDSFGGSPGRCTPDASRSGPRV